jgi:hypothetical protein
MKIMTQGYTAVSAKTIARGGRKGHKRTGLPATARNQKRLARKFNITVEELAARYGTDGK